MSDPRDKIPPPWLPAPYDETVTWAVRAFAKGLATEGQQQIVWHWIMRASGVDDQSYRPGHPDDTAFAEGKRFVALQLRKQLSPLVDPPPKGQTKNRG